MSDNRKNDISHKLSWSTMNRRHFLKQVGLMSGGIALASCGLVQTGSRNAPNVVYIISDDQAWGDYGFMGHEAIQTPNLDQLASESVLYPRGYSTVPLCCPSLASIVTGLHPHQHKITSNDPPAVGEGPSYSPQKWPEERKELRRKMIGHIDEVPTIPRMLKQRGYVSFQSGKWWLGHYSRGGFTAGMTHGDMERGGRHGDEGLKIGRETMQSMYDFIDTAGEDPFFIWYAPFLPHRPHNPPERLLKKYRDKTDSIHIARYWAMCEWFDETCGDLLSFLDDRGLTEETLVLYVCDNGWIQQLDAAGYAPRSKRSPYEGGVRTPIMARWPGHMTSRRDDINLASSIDLAVTTLHACGLAPTRAMQGVDLLDRNAVQEREAVFGAAYTHDAVDIDDPRASLRYSFTVAGSWKLILPAEPNTPDSSPELYNLGSDPYEQRNLAEANPDQVRQLRQRIREWWPEAVES